MLLLLLLLPPPSTTGKALSLAVDTIHAAPVALVKARVEPSGAQDKFTALVDSCSPSPLTRVKARCQDSHRNTLTLPSVWPRESKSVEGHSEAHRVVPGRGRSCTIVKGLDMWMWLLA